MAQMRGLTVEVVRDVLVLQPGLEKRALLATLRERGVPVADTTELNAFLYSHRDDFEWREGPRGRHWYVKRDTRVAPVSAGTLPVTPVGPGRPDLDLYPWQRRALAAWKRRSSCGVVEAVTGAGKTRLALQAMIDALRATEKVAVVVPTLELWRQWEAQVREHVAPRVGRRISIGRWGDGDRGNLVVDDVLISSAASAAHWQMLPVGQRGLLVADECHHYGARTWSQVLEPSFSHRLGLTATYERDDNGIRDFLDPYFGGVCYSLGYREALDEEVICPFRIAFVGVRFSPDEQSAYEEAEAKARRLRWRLIADWGVPAEPFGEFMQGVVRLRASGVEKGSRLAGMYLGAFTKRRQVLAACTAKHARLTGLSAAVSAADRTIVFAQTVQAADTAMEKLRASGHHGAVIEAAMDTDERKDAFDAFERGDYRVVAAPRLLDEGVDVPAADLAIVLASSRSRRHMIQRMGRIVRPKDDARSARLVILYVEGTAEDPVQGAHEDFLDEVLDVAENCAVFASDSTAAELNRYLAPHGWQRPTADRVCPRSAPNPGPTKQRSVHKWANDVSVDPDSVTERCIVRHASYGEGTVVSVGQGGSPMTVTVRFASGHHEIAFGAGHLEFVVE